MQVATGRALLRASPLRSVARRLPGLQAAAGLSPGGGRTSFTQHPDGPVVKEARSRLNRCEMYVPGTQAKLIPKAAKSAADVVVMDLEDSVAEHLKDEARANVVKALKEVDFGSKTVAIRINGLYSDHTYKDIIDVLSAGERADVFIIPMVGNAKDVYCVDAITTQVENSVGRKKRIGFGMIIEATTGMMNVDEIAGASRRNESLHFGVADYAASTKSRTTNIGGANELYGVLTHADGDKPRDFFWGDPWHYAMSRIVVAARAHGLRPVDGPFGDIKDPDAYRAQCQRAVALGFDGKWAIHPTQVALANEVFSPSEAQVTLAKRILQAMADAQRDGLGAVSLDGKLIDIASIKQASQIVAKHQAIQDSK